MYVYNYYYNKNASVEMIHVKGIYVKASFELCVHLNKMLLNIV